MKKCYLCGEFFNDHDVLMHEEHIIQQAIGGTLIANDILCLTCGRTLGETVDAPFNKIFDGIGIRLDIRKHRDKNRLKATKGSVFSKVDIYGNDLTGVEIIWKAGKVSPIKPTHRYTTDKSKVIVYAEEKQLKNYLKKVNKEINDTFDEANRPEIITCDDITGIINFPFEINNKAFKRGLAKIAIGFAANAGIDREYLDLAIDSNQRNIKEEITLIQFFPLSIFDDFIEKNKDEIGHYPAHTLILFTAASSKNILVCYIELFSTFQWYVILSKNYHGNPVYEGYSQRIDKVEDYKFEPGRRYYKEREMILSSLGIKQERIRDAYLKQKNLPNGKDLEHIEHEIIQEEYIKQKYKIYFNEELESSIRYVLNQCMRKIASNTLSLNEAMDILKNNKLFFKAMNEEEVFNSSSYRRCYIRDNSHHDYISTLIELYSSKDGYEKIKKYGHERMHMLSAHIQRKNMIDKNT